MGISNIERTIWRNEGMTAAQLADELRIKETYLKSHWKKIVERYGKTGITLVKLGRGDKAEFGIKNFDDEKIRWEVKEYK